MTRDEALLWLNDRIGKNVHVSVVLERGDSKITVVNGEGTLQHQHWRSLTSYPERLAGLPRDDLAGWYVAGETRFDLTELEGAEITCDVDDDTILVRLSGDVVVEIIEQEDLCLKLSRLRRFCAARSRGAEGALLRIETIGADA
jgi:hypothetical protein